MQSKNDPARRTSDLRAAEKQPAQPETRVGLRGCWELIIKLIIVLILIASLTAYLLQQQEIMNWYLVLVIAIMILLLIWLLLRQRHLVVLNCGLTEPNGCKHGDPNLLANHVLEPIIGTASGIGFSRYELEVFWSGTVSIPAAVIYSDNAGNPDTALTTGNHQVNNGTLGFVDLQQAALGAGVNIVTSTNFEVRLHVVGIDGSRRDCTTAFSVTAARAYIKRIGQAWAHNITNADEPLRRLDDAVSELAIVGGSISVRGAAEVYGCASEKIAEYHVWAIPGFAFAQPANGSAVLPAGDWLPVATVVYTSNDQRTYNTLDGMPDPDFLTNAGWFTRQICVWFDLNPNPICWDVPDLHEFWWESHTYGVSGKYTFLLQVIDTAGNTYYDIQRAWIDNKGIRGKIQGPAGISACQDIYILDVPGGILEITGYATDPLVLPADPTTTPTNDNFDRYRVGFRKQGAAADFWLDIPLAGGAPAHATLSPTTPVPTRAVWKGAAGDPVDPPAAVLAEWKLDWLTGGNAAVPADQRLAPSESCPYDIVLEVWDKTIVSEDGPHWTGRLTFPIKIHNAHA
ncbi:MAG TPA: hypothetical protein VJH03_15900 [Blastocatellia bacterium]|nr:hypothetical protein [Blastocatellia bacterium]